MTLIEPVVEGWAKESDDFGLDVIG